MSSIQIVAANTLAVSCFQESNQAEVSEGPIWYCLLTLEALRTVRAAREWDSTTYFLSDIEEEPE
jgi:translation initiation factor 2B subunit (eIF-2B alpha/beta/delta family)